MYGAVHRLLQMVMLVLYVSADDLAERRGSRWPRSLARRGMDFRSMCTGGALPWMAYDRFRWRLC
jgi:hypothetical protein